jgi:hypothetical protein
MSSTRVRRHIEADPTSVALLLADPSAVELWPRLTRAEAAPDGSSQGLVTIEVGSAMGALRLLPPCRTPTAFILRFDFDEVARGDAAERGGAAARGDESRPMRVEGRLELTLSSPSDGDPEAAPATDALLELRADRDLAADAAEFLARVAAAAKRRSHAA